VLSVVTGAVKSNGQTYFGDWSLPDDSIYKHIEEIIHQRACGIDGAEREPTIKYANNVVEDIIGGATGKVWRGARAGSVKFGSTYLPQTLMVCHTYLDHTRKALMRLRIRAFAKVLVLTRSRKLVNEGA